MLKMSMKKHGRKGPMKIRNADHIVLYTTHYARTGASSISVKQTHEVDSGEV